MSKLHPFETWLLSFWIRGREIAQLEQLEVTLKASIAKEEETAKDLAIKAQVFSFGEFKSEFQVCVEIKI